MPENIIDTSNFNHVEYSLRTGFSTERNGGYDVWKKKLSGNTVLDNNNIELKSASLECKRLFIPSDVKPRTESIAEKEYSVSKVITLSFSNNGIQQELQLQALEDPKQFNRFVYNLKLVTITPQEQMGQSPKQKTEWQEIVGKDMFFTGDFQLSDNHDARVQLTKSMSRIITGGSADVGEGILNTISEQEEKHKKVRHITRDHEKEGLRMVRENGSITVTANEQIETEGRLLIEQRLTRAMKRITEAGRILEKPEAHIHSVLSDAAKDPMNSDLILEDEKKPGNSEREKRIAKKQRRDDILNKI